MTYWSRIIEQLFKHLIWQNNQIVREVFFKWTYVIKVNELLKPVYVKLKDLFFNLIFQSKFLCLINERIINISNNVVVRGLVEKLYFMLHCDLDWKEILKTMINFKIKHLSYFTVLKWQKIKTDIFHLRLYDITFCLTTELQF